MLIKRNLIISSRPSVKQYIAPEGIGNFYDNSKGKIGKQNLNCNLKRMANIRFDWLEIDINDDRLRILLNGTFFSYQ